MPTHTEPAAPGRALQGQPGEREPVQTGVDGAAQTWLEALPWRERRDTYIPSTQADSNALPRPQQALGALLPALSPFGGGLAAERVGGDLSGDVSARRPS